MAKFETVVKGNFNEVVKRIEDGIINGSFTASLEESSNFKIGDALCSVRVFERYSYSGSNRVSLSVTFFQNSNSDILVSAITSGGSQAAFFKLNTFGEEAFLDKIKEVLR
ncbi:MAG: hypothetical protein J6V78_00860 [Clostridia bacterium]|nr:hypothetical protein [Clostridia bacterium]